MNIADTLGNCRIWGCSTFVLEPKLRKNGVKIPRWAPRSRQGVNLGFSRLHSSLVALVLHPTTKSITTQFHVVFDDAFSTVPHNGQIDPKSWQSLTPVPQLESGDFHNARLQTHLDPSDKPDLSDEWLFHDERLLRDHRRRQAAALRILIRYLALWPLFPTWRNRGREHLQTRKMESQFLKTIISLQDKSLLPLSGLPQSCQQPRFQPQQRLSTLPTHHLAHLHFSRCSNAETLIQNKSTTRSFSTRHGSGEQLEILYGRQSG
jgi:hypothetical protein